MRAGVKFPNADGAVRAPIFTPEDRRLDSDAELAMKMQAEMDGEENVRRNNSMDSAPTRSSYVEEEVSEAVLARNAAEMLTQVRAFIPT
jgi:hypothetical protein